MSGAIVVALLGGGSMLCLALGLWVPAYRRERAIKRRLAGFILAGRPGGLGLDLAGRRRARTPPRVASGQRQVFQRFLARQIASAQADLTLGEAILAMAIAAVLAFGLLGSATGSLAAGAVAAPLGAILPIVWLRRLAARLQTGFVAQLPDTVGLLSSSIRAGHSLLQALEHAAAEAPEPTRSAVALVVREIGLGASQEDALDRLAERFPSADLELVVTAINVQHQIGGSLSKILDVIAETVRERVRMAGDIRALTAQQRYSGYVLALLPVVVLAGLYLLSPDYVSIMFEYPVLQKALLGAGVLVALGFYAMRRVATIDV